MVHPEIRTVPTERNLANGHADHRANGVNGTNGVESSKASFSIPVAVVGMACRFAGGVKSPRDLWNLCTQARDVWSPIPEDRFDVKSLYHPDKDRPGRQHALGGYFMTEDVSRFDAAFFNFPADVASAMDPQIRLVLETVYEATEDAGIPIESLAGTNTSVFSGCYGKDYHDLQTRDPESMPPSFLTGNYTAMMSNRISHSFDLQGASMSIDTGCSSGIACLHQGCLTIQTGESDISIVGASNTILNPDLFLAMSTLGMVGADGRCYAWDERAQGYGRGEGAAVLVLKRLDAALDEGDHIHAIIRQTGLNQDGKTQSITSPSADAQIQLIQDCYRRAGLDPSETGYVEAHMTGTQAGDLTEAKALAQTFGKSRQRKIQNSDPVLVGSVKTNVGHTEAVSGLAAIIKAAYAMKTRKIPANLNYEITNPKIKLKDWNLTVPTALIDWPSDKPLRTSINNFGYGGTNSHVILEGAPVENGSLDGDAHVQTRNGISTLNESRVFIISAKDSNAARNMAKNLAKYLRSHIENAQELLCDDLAYTLAERRSRFDYTATVKARSLLELATHLGNPALKIVQSGTKKTRLGFVFNGQGAQWHAMGRELLATYPVFAAAIEEAEGIFHDYGADWSLREELMRDAKSTRVSEIHLSQPVTVALQLCLVRLLWSWNVHSSAVVSHSSGEIAAAFAVQALSFRQALGVVYYRGELARKYKQLSTQHGGMIAAGINAQDALKYMANTKAGGRVVVACVNSPESVTLSGDVDDIDEVLLRLEQDGLFARKLKVGLAYHSHHMLPMAPEYTQKLCDLLPKRSFWTNQIVFASPVTGNLISACDGLPPNHWVSNLTNPVQFSGAFEAMIESVDAIVEIGPHSTLSGPIRQILRGKKMAYTTCLKRNTDAVDTMQDLACDLLGLGYPLSLAAVNSTTRSKNPRFVSDLPTYAWNHTKQYWIESRINKDIRQRRFPPHELLGLLVPGGTSLVSEWRNFLRLADVPWLADHQVDSQIVLPGAAYVSMAVEAAQLLAKEQEMNVEGYKIRDTEFMSALTIPESSTVEVRLRLQLIANTSWYEFQVYSANSSGTWIENCRGQVSVTEDQDLSVAPGSESFLGPDEKSSAIDIPTLMSRLREMSIKYGPSFQNLTSGRGVANRSLMDLKISDIANESHTYIIHPTTLDCIIQATYNSLPRDTSKHDIVLPKYISSMFVPSHLNKQGGKKLSVFTELRKMQKRGFTSAVVATNSGNDKLLSPLRMENFFCQRIPRGEEYVSTDNDAATTLFKNSWVPDVLYDMPDIIKKSMRINLTDQETAFEKKMVRASYYFMFDAVSLLQNEVKDHWKECHKTMFDHMLRSVARGKKGELGPGSTMWSKATKGMKQKLFDELNKTDSTGQLLVRVGTKLSEILRDQADPVSLMMEGALLSKYYKESPKLVNRTYAQLGQLIKMYAAKNPGASVLEIGAGLGSTASFVLQAFSDQEKGSGSLLDRYVFTDPSPDMTKIATQDLAAWGDLIDFQKFDIEQDLALYPEISGKGTFDMIILSTMFHNYKNVKVALKNVQKLLAPGGKLLLVTSTQNTLDSQLIRGVLSDWSMSEESDRDEVSPSSVEDWEKLLREMGFNGVDFNVADCEQTQFQSSNLMLSSAPLSVSWPSAIGIVYTDQLPSQWRTQLVNTIQTITGVSPSLEAFHEAQPEEKLYIFTGEMTASFFSELDEMSFHKLRNLLLRSSGVMWLSCGGLIDSQIPLHAQTQGFLRTLRQEDSSKKYIHLDFEHTGENPWTMHKIKHIVHVLEQSMSTAASTAGIECEYAVKNGLLHVPRVFPDRSDNGDANGPNVKQTSFHQPGQSVAWQSQGLNFANNGQIDAKLPDDMIEVEVRAFGLRNTQSVVEDDSDAGYDLAGVVTRVGSFTEISGLHIGDRVCGIAKGDIASSVKVHWTYVVQIPEDISFKDAACIPTAYAAASLALIDIARLSRGEVVLVHSIRDHASQAAIVVAQQKGASVFATFNDNSERDVLINQFCLASDHVLATRDSSIGDILREKTNGQGLDVIFSDPASTSDLTLTHDCLGRFGRIIETGNLGTRVDQGRNLLPRERCATYIRVDIREIARYKREEFRKALKNGVQAYHTNRPAAPAWPIMQYHITKLGEALQRPDRKEHSKVVIIADEEAVVDVSQSPRPVSFTDSNATFLVVGGLGGIGRAIASWLIEKGAQNVLLVSRNAERHPDAALLLERAAHEACNLQIHNCDVSSRESLMTLLSQMRELMPPIRGVIDTAMVLSDSVFESMTFDQWKRAVTPKVAATINLDETLPQDMSFFIILSSVTGITGHISQTNYAAGNTFQDAFARHRVANGQVAISIDLPAVTGAGVVSDDEEARKRVEALGSKSIPIQDVLDLLEKMIQRRPSTQDEAQVIVNLEAWTELAPNSVVRCDKRFGTLRLGWQRGMGHSAIATATDKPLSPSAMLAQSLEQVASSNNEPIEKKSEPVARALATRLAATFSIDANDIDLSQPLAAHGVDSLVAVELRNWLAAAGGVKISIFEILQATSLYQIAALIIARKESK